MPDFKYKAVDATGSANSTVYADVLQSTRTERRYLHGIQVAVSDYKGNSIIIKVDREEVCVILDYSLDSYGSSGSTNVQWATNKLGYIEIERQLEEGEECKIGVQSGANATNIKGAYKYSIPG